MFTQIKCDSHLSSLHHRFPFIQMKTGAQFLLSCSPSSPSATSATSDLSTYLLRQVVHHVNESFLGYEVVVELVFLCFIFCREGLCTAQRDSSNTCQGLPFLNITLPLPPPPSPNRLQSKLVKLRTFELLSLLFDQIKFKSLGWILLVVRPHNFWSKNLY